MKSKSGEGEEQVRGRGAMNPFLAHLDSPRESDFDVIRKVEVVQQVRLVHISDEVPSCTPFRPQGRRGQQTDQQSSGTSLPREAPRACPQEEEVKK